MSVRTRPRRRLGWVESLSVLPPALAEQFLPVYRDAFAPLERLAPARQALTDEEFLEEMAAPSVLKLVGRAHDDDPCALAFLATDLTVVPWISLPYFAARYPEHYGRGAIYYVGGLLVRPDRQGAPWAHLVLEEMARLATTDRAVVAFDCCEHNVSAVRVPETFARVGRRLSSLETAELEPQRYFAYAFDSRS